MSATPAQFPYVAAASAHGAPARMPLLPIKLRLREGEAVTARGLLDSGSTVNVLPYALGLRVGANWEEQTTKVILTGALAAHEARALLLSGRVAEFEPVRLVFAWSRSENVPLLLGQVNFFEQFDVSFSGARHRFEVVPARR